MLLHTLGMVGGTASGIICYAMLLIIRPQPWWHAQYFIPTLGMLLGNCISGVSVGLSAIMEELTTGHCTFPRQSMLRCIAWPELILPVLTQALLTVLVERCVACQVCLKLPDHLAGSCYAWCVAGTFCLFLLPRMPFPLVGIRARQS